MVFVASNPMVFIFDIDCYAIFAHIQHFVKVLKEIGSNPSPDLY